MRHTCTSSVHSKTEPSVLVSGHWQIFRYGVQLSATNCNGALSGINVSNHRKNAKYTLVQIVLRNQGLQAFSPSLPAPNPSACRLVRRVFRRRVFRCPVALRSDITLTVKSGVSRSIAT
jgi:hypothetical protein